MPLQAVLAFQRKIPHTHKTPAAGHQPGSRLDQGAL